MKRRDPNRKAQVKSRWGGISPSRNLEHSARAPGISGALSSKNQSGDGGSWKESDEGGGGQEEEERNKGEKGLATKELRSNGHGEPSRSSSMSKSAAETGGGGEWRPPESDIGRKGSAERGR